MTETKGTSEIVGVAYKMKMYGSNAAATNFIRPSTSPPAMPSTIEMASAVPYSTPDTTSADGSGPPSSIDQRSLTVVVNGAKRTPKLWPRACHAPNNSKMLDT